MRPIDADAIPKEFLEYEFDGKWNGCTIKDLIDEQPTIQSQSTAGQLNDGVRSTAQSTDLIDRQDAIDALDCINGAEEVLRSLPSVQPEPTRIIPETRAIPSDDDRVSLSERVTATYYDDEYEEWSQRTVTVRDVLDAVCDEYTVLPTIQPEPQWIPCSERMPEEHEWLGTKKFGTTISDEVYVTFEDEKGERFCNHLSFQNGELSSYDQFHMDTWFKGSKPIAWMPLPKPFEGGIK